MVRPAVAVGMAVEAVAGGMVAMPTVVAMEAEGMAGVHMASQRRSTGAPLVCCSQRACDAQVISPPSCIANPLQ